MLRHARRRVDDDVGERAALSSQGVGEGAGDLCAYPSMSPWRRRDNLIYALPATVPKSMEEPKPVFCFSFVFFATPCIHVCVPFPPHPPRRAPPRARSLGAPPARVPVRAVLRQPSASRAPRPRSSRRRAGGRPTGVCEFSAPPGARCDRVGYRHRGAPQPHAIAATLSRRRLLHTYEIEI